jgi:hypothetical protein
MRRVIQVDVSSILARLAFRVRIPSLKIPGHTFAITGACNNSNCSNIRVVPLSLTQTSESLPVSSLEESLCDMDDWSTYVS